MEIKYQRILVAVDGSAGAEAALKKAVKVAQRQQAHLDILQVLNLNSLSYDGNGLSLDGKKVYQVEQVNESYLQNLKQKLIDEKQLPAAEITTHLRFGNPKTVIVNDFQPEYQNDLIIVGATGKNFIERLIVGSVASYVIRAARCDVLLAH
ncbi:MULTISPECIES: universal stress protein [Liquorilactobacillus]|nr:universal stress protein [Liquorilactobacillus ghanensis]